MSSRTGFSLAQCLVGAALFVPMIGGQGCFGEVVTIGAQDGGSDALVADASPDAAAATGVTAACPASEAGPNRNCGYMVEGSHSCVPGAPLEVGCSAACGLGTCTGDSVLRVCPGETPCTAAEALVTNDDSSCASPDRCSRGTTTCPASGRFTVLWGAFLPGQPTTCDVQVRPPPTPTTGPTAPCAAGTSTAECGYTVSNTYACTPGASVTAGCSAQCGLGSCSGDPMLRVCAGTTLCDHASALGENDDSSCGGGDRCSQTAFTCPAGGQITVLWRPFATGAAATCNVAVH